VARERRRRRRGPTGSEAQEVPKAPAYIKRKIPHYSILSDDELSIIEENADTILEEIGIVFSEDQESLDILSSISFHLQIIASFYPMLVIQILILQL